MKTNQAGGAKSRVRRHVLRYSHCGCGLRAAERKALERAAKAADTSVSAWARDVLLAQAELR